MAKKKLADVSLSPVGKRHSSMDRSSVSPLAPRSPNIERSHVSSKGSPAFGPIRVNASPVVNVGPARNETSISPWRDPVTPSSSDYEYVDDEVAFKRPSRHDPAHREQMALSHNKPVSRFSMSPHHSHNSHSQSPRYGINEEVYNKRMRSPSPYAGATMASRSSPPPVPIAQFVSDVIQEDLDAEKAIIMAETDKVRHDIRSTREQVTRNRNTQPLLHSYSKREIEIERDRDRERWREKESPERVN